MNAEEYRRAFPKTHNLEVAPGLFFKVRRVSHVRLLSHGLLPTTYLNEVSRNWRRAMGQNEPTPDGANQTEIMRIILAVVCDACVEPRLVQGEPGEGELSVFDDVEDAHIMTIFNWAMGGAKGVPVETERGEVAVDDLLKFREDGTGGATDAPGRDSADVRAEALSDARTAG